MPLVGGVIGGTFDGTTTYTIGKVAKKLFVTGEETSDDDRPEEADLMETLSRMLFGEDAEQDREPYRRDHQERQDQRRSSSPDRFVWDDIQIAWPPDESDRRGPLKE